MPVAGHYTPDAPPGARATAFGMRIAGQRPKQIRAADNPHHAIITDRRHPLDPPFGQQPGNILDISGLGDADHRL